MAPARIDSNRRSRAENGRSLRELAVFLEDGAAFRLGLAVYDVPRTREEWLGRLATEMAGRSVHLLRLDLSREPGETLLLRRLEELLRTAPVPEGKVPAVMVTGLEATIDFRPMPGTLFVQGGDLLRNANLQRDAFPERCPAPVVIWLNSAGATAFTQTAPDLGQWCTGIFQFKGHESGRAELEKGLISLPRFESDGLFHEEKRQRISLLQDLLLELEKSSQSETPGNIARRAALHYELGNAFLSLSDAGTAQEHLGRSLELARRTGDRVMEENSLGTLGNAQMILGRVDQAIALYQEALELAERIGDRKGIGTALGNLGIAYAWRGERDRALNHLERDLEVSSQSSDRRGAGQTLNNIAAILTASSRFDEALPYVERALDIARSYGDLIGISKGINNLASIYYSRGEVLRALSYLEESLEIARRLGDRWQECRVLGNLGRLYLELGQVDRGIEMLERVVRLGRVIGNPEVVESAERYLSEAKGLKSELREATEA